MKHPRQLLSQLLPILVCLLALPLARQSTLGELRLRVTDPRGSAIKTEVQVVSEVNQYDSTLATDDSGVLIAKHLPFGLYRVRIQQPGFATASLGFEVRSAVPLEASIRLTLASAKRMWKISITG
jgi:hypothetical protein